jgi:steroid delta-isomerase-like uncharacterized protein
MEPEDSNKATVGRLIDECVNANRPDLAGAFVHADVVIHAGTPVATPDTSGLEEFQGVFELIHRVFPDLQVEVGDLISEGDRVAVRWVARGTHSEEWAGVPATGRVVQIGGMDIYRFRAGRIAEWWRNEDMYSLVQQLTTEHRP